MIRFILVCIVVIAYLVLTIPVLLVEWIIGKFSPMTKDISSLRMVQAIFKFILWITGAKVTVIGEENVPKDQAVLYIGHQTGTENHPSGGRLREIRHFRMHFPGRNQKQKCRRNRYAAIS